jgi:hypothetical protein
MMMLMSRQQHAAQHGASGSSAASSRSAPNTHQSWNNGSGRTCAYTGTLMQAWCGALSQTHAHARQQQAQAVVHLACHRACNWALAIGFQLGVHTRSWAHSCKHPCSHKPMCARLALHLFSLLTTNYVCDYSAPPPLEGARM